MPQIPNPFEKFNLFNRNNNNEKEKTKFKQTIDFNSILDLRENYKLLKYGLITSGIIGLSVIVGYCVSENSVERGTNGIVTKVNDLPNFPGVGFINKTLNDFDNRAENTKLKQELLSKIPPKYKFYLEYKVEKVNSNINSLEELESIVEEYDSKLLKLINNKIFTKSQIEFLVSEKPRNFIITLDSAVNGVDVRFFFDEYLSTNQDNFLKITLQGLESLKVK